MKQSGKLKKNIYSVSVLKEDAFCGQAIVFSD